MLDCPLQPQANQHAGRLRQLAPTLPKHDFHTGRSAAKRGELVGRSSRLRLAHGSGVQQRQHHLVDDLNDHLIGNGTAVGQKVKPHHR